MDVVAREVGRLQGTIELASQPGLGTTLTLRVPARLALEPVLVVRVGGRPFALPLASIERALAPTDAEVGVRARASRSCGAIGPSPCSIAGGPRFPALSPGTVS